MHDVLRVQVLLDGYDSTLKRYREPILPAGRRPTGSTCSGVCHGECDADFSGTCGGICDGKCDKKTVNGPCAAKCVGKCESAAQGTCSGRCSGTCELKTGGTPAQLPEMSPSSQVRSALAPFNDGSHCPSQSATRAIGAEQTGGFTSTATVTAPIFAFASPMAFTAALQASTPVLKVPVAPRSFASPEQPAMRSASMPLPRSFNADVAMTLVFTRAATALSNENSSAKSIFAIASIDDVSGQPRAIFAVSGPDFINPGIIVQPAMSDDKVAPKQNR